jgi:hypothetical protein
MDCVWWDEDAGCLACGSRNYELIAPNAEDNAQFRSWCESDGAEQDALRAFCEARPSLVVYGEWMGERFTGAFKKYDRCALSTFLIFDVFDRG